ncbi:CoA transferase [Streptomyces sp. NBC_01591]|uniref:CoA transferase n=1 Tax=Streptomyces sp. NBC_01591 TaxID=2975888 RepID=UPI002DDC63ED|nr:CoA transferase [Streptomyces sp. NBC_01591]WSD67686.1 CoA transferase [Streptomyces sp. NBC_01591]
MNHARKSGTEQAWAALGGDPALLAHIGTDGPGGLLPARLPVMELARSAVAVCSLAAAELAARRTARPVPRVRIDDGAVATAFTSERHLRIDGRAPTTFAPLSRFWRTADGWVRTHANYPHHRARLLATLGLPADTPDNIAVDTAAASFAGRRGEEIEQTVYAAGGLAVAARTPGEWAADPRGAAVAGTPLVARERIDSAPVRRTAALTGEPLLPAAGLRVLDLTRVIAGPVATRTLALLGADVLRIDAPQLPESPDAHSDTGFGKRSVDLDLGSRSGSAAFDGLLADADVVVIGYRPGAVERFGLTPESLAARRPGLVIGRLSAWGHGPWARQRGFDSLVQVATGIASVEAAGPGSPPGALPAQALDHGTGCLLAAAVLRALTEQHDEGGSRLATLSLARTAAWLLDELPAPAPGETGTGCSYDPEKWLTETDSRLGRLRHAVPPVSFDGSPADWSRPPGPLGADAAAWITA